MTTDRQTGLATSTWQARVSAEGLDEQRPWWRRLGRRNGVGTVHDQLLNSLNDVAAAVSSTLSVDEVLKTIVERAKRVTNTDKAVLLLTTEHGEALDFETLNVRGARSEHPEDWWSPRLQAMASEILHNGRTYLDHDETRGAWLLCAPIKIKEQPIGLLCAINNEARPFTEHETEYLAILSSFAAAAVVNARLSEQHHYVLLASERDRIAREMHDGIAQSLFSISLGLELCKKQAANGDLSRVTARLEELQDELNSSMDELRRVIYDLRPAKLKDLGLIEAINHWVREATSGREVKGKLTVGGEQALLSGATEACLYRVAKEATSNVVKHASASSFEVTLDHQPSAIVLTVIDDGIGFDVDLARRDALINGSLGLHSISERVRIEGGDLQISSVAGKGTTVRVELPL
ncbi:MAG: GAF domain-containing sensor histidine kinase [Coriobacteriia bacterium]|jgi:signal transduction histidine kinase|nr:GAF domain-containing sensor histidine kinase [Coriobacteriia bacterium]